MSTETVLCAIVLLGSLLPLVLRSRKTLPVFFAAVLLAAGVFALASWAPPLRSPPAGQRPLQLKETNGAQASGFVSSNECRSCHPQEYATWHASYHRTMTQVVGPDTVLADFEDLELWFDGRPYNLSRRDGEFWVELSDPNGVDEVIAAAQRGDISLAREMASRLPRVRRRIVMSTGSHHYQLYWYSSGSGRELYMLPFAYLIAEKRWVPRVSIFLIPPNEVEHRKAWNRDCMPCHSTGGAPGYAVSEIKSNRLGAPDSHTAEVGIACEACHGPSADHVAANRNPLRRYEFHLSAGVDPSAVQPERLEAARSSEVCGQCHSVNTNYTFADWAQALEDGSPYRAGGELRESTYVVSRETVSESPLFQSWIEGNQRTLDEWFWPDGEIRVAGREYNGLLESPCYQGGEFSCISCHSMHGSDPNDQLAPEMDGDQACLQCHEKFQQDIEKHTRHAVQSSGSRCYNCHMPHTTYGLLKAVRSHRISNPSVSSDLESGRTNACNLCHLDQTLAWTQEHLSDWYDAAEAAVEGDQRTVAAGVLGLLQGDAGARAILAWHMGWEPAQTASRADWMAPFLARALDDPYDAVRYIGSRSLGRVPGFASFQYDYLAPPAERRRAVSRAMHLWKLPSDTPWRGDGGRVLIRPDGTLRSDQAGRLLDSRDQRPIYLVE